MTTASAAHAVTCLVGRSIEDARLDSHEILVAANQSAAGDAMDIYDITQRNGGATIRVRDMSLVTQGHGYVVGLVPGTAAKVQQYAGDLTQMVVEAVAQTFDTPYVGTWVGPDGYIHIDPVEIIDDLSSALSSGYIRGQQGIYSFMSGDVIEL